MEPKSTCVNCNESYTADSLGSIGCSFHPRPFNHHFDGQNHPKNSYDCCGSKLNAENQSTIDKFNNGCQWIDHISSDKELQSVIERPYVCLKRQDFEKLKLSQMLFGEDKKTIRTQFDDFSKTAIVPTSSGKVFVINLAEECAKLFDSARDTDELNTESSEIYYRDEVWDLANVITEKPKTAEIFIVFRVPANKRVIHVEVSQ